MGETVESGRGLGLALRVMFWTLLVLLSVGFTTLICAAENEYMDSHQACTQTYQEGVTE